MCCRVIQPGMLTTVQDLGRTGLANIGVPPGGAADAFSFSIANRLAGNDQAAPALECTLTGPTLRFDTDATVAITGAPADVHLDHQPVAQWTALLVQRDQTLRVGAARAGCRMYVAVRGGFQIPRVLGSASTLLSAGFGGIDGRPLRTGDQLALQPGDHPLARTPDLKSAESFLTRRIVRAIEAPLENRFDRGAAEQFWSTIWTVSNRSDRMGVRLEGPGVATLCAGRMTSEGMPHGAVEIPADGQPIALGVEHPTTGGYPPIACVATIDLPLLGQLRPRDSVRFQRITREEALALLREQTHQIDLLFSSRG